MLPNASRLACILAALLVSCSHPSHTAQQQTRPDRFSGHAPADRYPNDVARFLAGLPGNPGSPFSDLENHEAWLHHRNESDRAWAGMESGPLPSMRAFQKSELNQRSITAAPVFYPFSGPDALMITTFFPHSPRYVMVGLEPAGTLPDRKQFDRRNLDAYLTRIRATLGSELHSSFFITRQMDRQFRGQITDGLILPILYLLARTNHTVLGFRYVRLDDAGNIIGRAADYHVPGRIGNKGVEIDCRSDDDGIAHQLFYFSVNLSDSRLREDPAFLNFLPAVNGSVTFLKATSYMTHRGEFSTIRDQVLAKSIAVLQDDSGIPYRFFTAPWRVQLYGTYVRPYGSFKWLQQTDLKKAYGDRGTKPLDFRIGYGYSKVPSNLLLASR